MTFFSNVSENKHIGEVSVRVKFFSNKLTDVRNRNSLVALNVRIIDNAGFTLWGPYRA